MELDEFLDFVSKDDDLGLLKVKLKTSAPTADEHLLAKFNEVNEFVAANGREPNADMSNVPEYMLHQRLEAIRGNDEQCEALRGHDVHSLLPAASLDKVAEPKAEYVVEKELNSLDDIFSDDTLGLLDDDPDGIFRIKNVPLERAETDFVARRKQCKDFAEYQDQFRQVQRELKDGKRQLFRFSDSHLRDGGYFVMDGVLLWLKSIDAEIKEQSFTSGSRTRKDGRTHIIFENGTESNMLYRSLYKQLLKSGQSVSETNDESLAMFEKNLSDLSEDDQASAISIFFSP